MKNGQNLKLGDAHATPKKYPRGTSVKAWECPRGTPSSSVKIRSPFKTLYFYCFMYYAFFLERQLFCFQFSFALFAAINVWITSCVWRETCSAFHLPRTLHFSLLSFQRVFSFSATAFSFRFSPWFLFRSCFIFASRCILTSGLCWLLSKELSQKGLNGVGKEKSFMQKSGTKSSLFRLRLRLLHAMLDCVLIVCLLIFAVA
jgi:hypothetical protein